MRKPEYGGRFSERFKMEKMRRARRGKRRFEKSWRLKRTAAFYKEALKKEAAPAKDSSVLQGNSEKEAPAGSMAFGKTVRNRRSIQKSSISFEKF